MISFGEWLRQDLHAPSVAFTLPPRCLWVTNSRPPRKRLALLAVRRRQTRRRAMGQGELRAAVRPGGRTRRRRSERPSEHQEAGSQQIEDVAADLEQRRPRAVAYEPTQEAARHAAIAQKGGGVPERRGHREHAEPLKPADAAAEESRSEEQDEQGGDEEEPRQAHALAPTEDRPAQGRRRRDAGDAAQDATPSSRRGGLRHDAPEEEHGLRALPEHAREGDQADDPQPLSGARLVDALLDLAPDAPRVLLHPPGVPGEQEHGQEDHPGADQVGAEIEQRAGEEADRDAHGHARPEPQRAADRHPPEVRAGTDLVEIRVNESKQEGGLEGLAQGDEEGGTHSAAPTRPGYGPWPSSRDIHRRSRNCRA